MESFIDYDKKLIDDYIDNNLNSRSCFDKNITEMMRYSVLGGKRLRGILAIEFGKMLGLKEENILPYSMALECVHAYSLIHDDLPCMDNDDYRRGKLSSHKKFGESNAVLSGDALLTLAFEVVCDAEISAIYPDRAVKIIKSISYYSGYDGMVGGQVLDLNAADNKVSDDELNQIHSLKTCALIKAASLAGCIAAGASDDVCNLAKRYADSFGHAFQIIDDIIDSHDNKVELNSSVAVIGLDNSVIEAKKYIDDIFNVLNELKCKGYFTDNLKSLAYFLLDRMEKNH